MVGKATSFLARIKTIAQTLVVTIFFSITCSQIFKQLSSLKDLDKAVKIILLTSTFGYTLFNILCDKMRGRYKAPLLHTEG